MGGLDSTRDPLLGLIAIRLGLTSRESLSSAIKAWSRDGTKSLGEILLEKGALDADALSLLESVVEEQLRQHGGDPEKALSAFCALNAIPKEQSETADSLAWATDVNIDL